MLINSSCKKIKKKFTNYKHAFLNTKNQTPKAGINRAVQFFMLCGMLEGGGCRLTTQTFLFSSPPSLIKHLISAADKQPTLTLHNKSH